MMHCMRKALQPNRFAASLQSRSNNLVHPMAQPYRTGPTGLYHCSQTCATTHGNNNKDSMLDLFTDNVLSDMLSHHERRGLTNLNLFLQHDCTPKLIGWHPDLICDGDYGDDHQLDDHASTNPEISWHEKFCLNRNARYGNKKSKGKRPCSRQARRRKKRSIGNHRR